MACKTSYELHHNFPKLADEAGFAFNTHRPKIRLDWNRIKLLDVDSLIKDRKFILLEQHLNDVLDCVLESEFDVRILDEGVVKMFRLAQLTVEYQQFCRHYLDRSIFVLRDELTSIMQELESTKNGIRAKEDEIRKLKRKSKHHNYRPPLYGNDNIANMILKTLSNRGDLFSSRTIGEMGPQYNKCSYCDKIFMNQLYLKSHLQRRHAEFLEAPEKDSPEPSPHTEARETKINSEIAELKEKLKDMESKLTNTHNMQECTAAVTHEAPTTDVHNETKNAEVSAFNDSYFLEKIEEWKIEESNKYKEELDKLRIQMVETINALKEKETKTNSDKDIREIQQLNKTINEQGEEIMKLKEELSRTDTKAVIEDANRKDVEAQVLLWTKKVEEQSVQYQRLVENLNAVAREAQEARALAEAESRRAANLQAQLLAKKDSDKMPKAVVVDKAVTASPPKQDKNGVKLSHKPKSSVNRNSLEDLHRKAQELLSVKTSSSSESSNNSDEDFDEIKINHVVKQNAITNNIVRFNNKEQTIKTVPQVVQNKINNGYKLPKKKTKKKPQTTQSKSLLNPNIRQENEKVPPRSPQKVIRAKLTEEVSSRLVTAGVDPLKNGLNKAIYNKQYHRLQKEQRLKIKKNGKYENIRNSILFYLDTKVGKETKDVEYPSNTSTKPKTAKNFSLTSMISNVKHKALSLVKADINNQHDRKRRNTQVERTVTSSMMPHTDSGSQNSSSSPEKQNRHVPDLFKISKRPVNHQVSNKSARSTKANVHKEVTMQPQDAIESSDDETGSGSEQGYDTFPKDLKKSVDKLIKSPIRRPATASGNYNEIKTVNIADQTMYRAQSAMNLFPSSPKHNEIGENKNDDSDHDNMNRRNASGDNIQVGPKGVLKNAPSTSSLNKKKVLFDLDAIQMKSVSASPSQSTEKSDINEKFELGLVNLDDEEWDISSIDNEPMKNNEHVTGRISVASRTSPKISELKESIESQLARRNPTPSTLVVGGVDVLGARAARAASLAGSNTSLGSSVFDTDDAPTPRSTIKSKVITQKDDSDLDLSEFSVDGVISNKKRDSF